MLKPYVCAVCEKVVVDSDGVASLISLFNKMIVNTSPIKAGDPMPEIPPNAVVPKEWAIFSSWDVGPEDKHKNFVACAQILFPDESPFGDVHKLPLVTGENRRTQNIFRVMGFPIGQSGFYSVQIWLEENHEKVVGPITISIEIEIQHQPQVVQ